MLKIVLIWPGVTEYDRQGRVQGTLDIPLSDEGRQQVKTAVKQLKSEGIKLLYASPCEAATQTAQSIAKALDLKLKVVDKLQNLDHGLWQGMLIDEVKAKQPKVYRQWQEQPENVCPPGGEMLSAVRQRVGQVLNKLTKKHKDGVVGLVVPEPLARVVAGLLRDETIDDLWRSTPGATFELIPVTPGLALAST